MSETASGDQFRAPVILGANGDIGRTVVQQLAAAGLAPAGIVLTPRRLADEASRNEAAGLIASNYAPEGEATVLDGVELTADPVLRVGDSEIPVFTSDNEHEIFQEGHPVIDATGEHETREELERILNAGAEFVIITSPFKKDDTVTTVVYGVNSDEEKFIRAREEGVLSTSSCTTTAVTSLLGPLLLGEERIPLSGAMVSVMHARTKSNVPEDIANNIKLSSSGAIKEIPKVLDITPEQMVFDLECIRANAACGSLATVRLLFGHEFHTYNLSNLLSGMKRALKAGESSYDIDGAIEDTKGVIGRKESAVINLGGLVLRKMPGGGSAATGIQVFYDNVAGYTRSVMDSYKRMASLREEE